MKMFCINVKDNLVVHEPNVYCVSKNIRYRSLTNQAHMSTSINLTANEANIYLFFVETPILIHQFTFFVINCNLVIYELSILFFLRIKHNSSCNESKVCL